MPEPRVLMVTGEYPPMAGGIADYTRLLVDALTPLGVDVHTMSLHGTEATEQVTGWDWSTPGAVRGLIRRAEINIVHIQYQAGAFAMHPAVNLLPALVRDVPVVTTFHDLRPPYLFPKAGRLRFLALRRMARWSDAVIVTNRADVRVLEESQIAVCRIPLGPSLPRPDTIAAHDNSVGYFGFPSVQKGFDRLLAAIGQLPEASRPELRIIGGMPPANMPHGFMTREDVEQCARCHAVQLSWTGYLAAPEASRALATCGVIAFPFPSGATLRSSALIAALQTGRPVITTTPQRCGDLGGLENMEQLVLVSDASPNVLASAIEAALDRQHATDRLPADFTWEHIAHRHCDLYARLLGESRR